MKTAEKPDLEPQVNLGQLLPNFTSTFFSHGFMLVGAVVINIITARGLGPAGKGEYTLAVNFFLVISIAAGLGLGQANVYFVGKRGNIKQIVANSLLVAVAGGLLLLLGIWLFGASLSKLLAGLSTYYLLAIGAVLPFQLFLTFGRHIFLGQGLVKTYNFMRNFEVAAQACILVFLLVSSHLSVWSSILSFILAVLITLAVMLFKLRDSLALSINLSHLRQSVAFGIRAYVAEIAQFLNFRLDAFLVAFYLNFASVGYYAVAVSIAQVMSNLPLASSTVLFSTSANSKASNMDSITPHTCRIVVMILFLSAVCVFFLGQFAINLIFGPAFGAAVPALKLLLPGMLALGVYQILYSDLAGRGRPEIGTAASLIALSGTLFLDLILIPMYGISGAAIASSVSYSLGATYIALRYSRLTGKSMSDILIIKLTDLQALRHWPAKI